MKGTEEEVSKRVEMWERRYANVPVSGDGEVVGGGGGFRDFALGWAEL